MPRAAASMKSGSRGNRDLEGRPDAWGERAGASMKSGSRGNRDWRSLDWRSGRSRLNEERLPREPRPTTRPRRRPTDCRLNEERLPREPRLAARSIARTVTSGLNEERLPREPRLALLPVLGGLPGDASMKSGSRGNRDRVAILPLLSSANESCGEDWLPTVSYTHLTLPTTPYV